MILEVSLKIPEAFLMSAAEHEGCQIFFTHSRNSKGTFNIRWVLGVEYGTRIGQILNLACKESWYHSHCSNAAVGLNCINMC